MLYEYCLSYYVFVFVYACGGSGRQAGERVVGRASVCECVRVCACARVRVCACARARVCMREFMHEFMHEFMREFT